MSKRIQQLELALQAEHSSNSSAPSSHPLLTNEMLAIKNGTFLFENHEGSSGGFKAVEPEAEKREEEEEEEEDIVNSLGVLSVSEGGETQFVGQLGFQV